LIDKSSNRYKKFLLLTSYIISGRKAYCIFESEKYIFEGKAISSCNSLSHSGCNNCPMRINSLEKIKKIIIRENTIKSRDHGHIIDYLTNVYKHHYLYYWDDDEIFKYLQEITQEELNECMEENFTGGIRC